MASSDYKPVPQAETSSETPGKVNLKKLADEAVLMACKQLETSIKFKKTRLEEIRKNVDEYYNRVKKPLKGRYNIPVPVMAGFVDTLMAKTDERIRIKFGSKEPADFLSSLRVSSAWKFDSSPQRGKWDLVDRGVKKLAAFSGVGIYQIFSESPYRNHFVGVHYADFHCEPMGGQDLEKHGFLGRTNIFRMHADIRKKGEAGIYDKEQVTILLDRYQDKEYKVLTDLYDGSLDSFRAMGMDPEGNTYMGQPSCILTEWGMVIDGVRYYMVFDYKTKTWVRFEPLTKAFPTKKGEDELWPWTAWHTHEDPKLFWSKAPCDDMRAVSVTIRVLANQELMNRERRNAGQRLIDPRVIKDPSQLPWQPEGIVIGDSTVRPISEGVYEFKTPELVGTINLINWFDAYTGRKTGITPDIQGAAETDKVGINAQNIQQAADRIGLMNKSYNDAYVGLGLRYFRGLRTHLDETMAVAIMGEEGAEWHTMSTRDVNPLRVASGASELEADFAKRKEQRDTLILISGNPRLLGGLNPNTVVEELLTTSDFDQERIRALMDTMNYRDRRQIAQAAQENEQMLAGKMPKPYRGATPGHLQHHLDFAMESNLSPRQFRMVMAHIESEKQIALSNAARTARANAQAPVAAPAAPVAAAPVANA